MLCIKYIVEHSKETIRGSVPERSDATYLARNLIKITMSTLHFTASINELYGVFLELINSHRLKLKLLFYG